MEIAKIMPAFMNIKPGNDMELGLDYIKNFCIGERFSESISVHNMVFYFFLELNKESDLLEYLEKEELKKSKDYPIFFEV